MNASEIINNATISRLGIVDTDTSLDGSISFADIKGTIASAIEKIDDALPKMKAAGVDMEKASFDARGLFRAMVRRGWGGNEVDFYFARHGQKSITAVNQRHIDDIVDVICDKITNY